MSADISKKGKSTSFQRIKGVFGFNTTAKKKELTEKEKHDKILLRQRLLELVEITPQTWSFVFGDEVPLYKKEVNCMIDITPRNIWMESLFLFSQIKAFRPDEIFHGPESYALKWQPPGSSFRFSIPLVDLQVKNIFRCEYLDSLQFEALCLVIDLLRIRFKQNF